MKPSPLYFIFVFLCLIKPATAHGTSLDLDTTKSSQTQTNSIGLDGDFTDSIYSWSLSGSKSTAKSTDATTGDIITDNSIEASAGLSFITDNLFDGGLNYSYTKTEEENLVNSGPSLNLGYTYKFSESEEQKPKKIKTDETSEENKSNQFRPSLGFNLKIGQQTYVQKFSTTVTGLRGRITKPVSGSNSITQRSNAASLKIKPFNWMSLKFTATRYGYSSDVNTFLQYIDSHQVLAEKLSGLSNALSGFYENTFETALYFYILDDWELDLSHSVSKIISDQSLSTTNSIELSYDLNTSWKFRVSADSSLSNIEGSTASTSASLGMSYTF